jgi:tRNA modification GTPase
MLTAVQLTPQGRGAVATIGLRGDLAELDASFVAANGIPAARQPLDRICFGRWGNEPAEEVVYVRTDERQAELHCHGGPAAVQRVLRDVQQLRGIVLTPEEFLEQTVSPLEAECRRALLQATTRKTAHHLLRQSVRLPALIGSLASVSREDRIQIIDRMLTWSDFGIHLTTPWKVVLCGRPNVGKSSLINALLGYSRAVVFDQPGTTRDVVAAETSLAGWPVEFSDTAGLRETVEGLESAGISRARKRLQEADLIVIVLDAAAGITQDDERLLAEFPNAIRVVNKIDLLSSEQGLPRFDEPGQHDGDERWSPLRPIPVSAVTGTGVEQLIEMLVRRLVPEEPECSEIHSTEHPGHPEGPAFPVCTEQVARLRHLRLLAVQDAEESFRELVETWCTPPNA